MIKKKHYDKINNIFLCLALSFIAVLTFFKWQDYKQWYSALYDSPFAEKSLQKGCDKATGISNGEFHHFVKKTGYLTWREKVNLWPNWRYPDTSNDSDVINPSWLTIPEEEIMWLTEDDIVSFKNWHESML